MKLKTINNESFETQPEMSAFGKFACAAIAVLLTLLTVSGFGQQVGEPQQANQKTQIAPRPELQQAYRPAPRDPFKRDVKPKEEAKKAANKQQAPKLLGFPALEVRRAEFRRLVDIAVSSDRPEPDPISQYLVSELDVIGLFRDTRGPGAFVRATPTGTTFFVRGGTRVYNGEVLRIENDDTGAGPSQVHFREVSLIETNGKQSPQEKVVTKVPTVAPVKK